MTNDEFSELKKAYESAIEPLRPFQNALNSLQDDMRFSGMLGNQDTRFEAVNSAFNRGILDSSLTNAISKMMRPYQEISGMEAVIHSLGSPFKSLINPEFYSVQSALQSSIGNFKLYDRSLKDERLMQSALGSLTQVLGNYDTSWLNSDSSWLVEKEIISHLDISSIRDMNDSFSALCRLEQATSLIPEVPSSFTSAASQIASIAGAFNSTISAENLLSSTQLMADYCNLASNQHRMIQKSMDHSDIDWRLGIIDAASKYVDRQISWLFGLADEIPELDSVGNDISDEEIQGKSAVSLIPVHLGYTKRNNVHETPTEGFEKSSIVSITEKGKRITENIIEINKLQLDSGQDRIFELSETSVQGMMSIGTVVCTDDIQLGKVIDGMYFIFYENLEHIKLFIGLGDKAIGNKKVREEELYQPIFNIKTIRNDMRHDLDHGSEKERKKKLMNVGECYKHYCGRRPIKPSDYRKLQERVYDEMLMLLDGFISIKIDDNQQQ